MCFTRGEDAKREFERRMELAEKTKVVQKWTTAIGTCMLSYQCRSLQIGNAFNQWVLSTCLKREADESLELEIAKQDTNAGAKEMKLSCLSVILRYFGKSFKNKLLANALSKWKMHAKLEKLGEWLNQSEGRCTKAENYAHTITILSRVIIRRLCTKYV